METIAWTLEQWRLTGHVEGWGGREKQHKIDSSFNEPMAPNNGADPYDHYQCWHAVLQAFHKQGESWENPQMFIIDFGGFWYILLDIPP